MTQGEALRILTTGVHAFLTGEPGAGKTHTINQYIGWLRERGIEPAITASTGIAATHVGGMTLHAWSGIGIRDHLTPEGLDEIISKEHLVKRHQKASVLIIDEVSMLSGEVLSMVDRVLKETRRSDQAFGGLQVVMVGDFFQLPPIQKAGRSATFAFESPVWSTLNPLPLYLHEQYRQEEGDLMEILRGIRATNSEPGDVSKLLTREAEMSDLSEETPRLYTHNADVDRENSERLAALPGFPRVFLMTASGAPPLIESLKRGCLSPERLELKGGAVVMFTKNNPILGYQNGTLGIVRSFDRNGGFPVVELTDGRELTVSPNEWVVEEGGKVRARIEQIPLKLAWAVTVHKSQGQSLDAAAIDLSRAFEYGQGYVALSRLRSLSGLYLLGWSEEALKVHPLVAAKDKDFKRGSETAAHAFNELHESGERTALEEAFVTASGGTLVPGEKVKAVSTYEATRVLVAEGKSLSVIAKERGLAKGTVANHIEKLFQEGAITKEDVEGLLSGSARKALLKIHAAFDEVGSERLAPAFSHLGKKCTFEDLKLARALYV